MRIAKPVVLYGAVIAAGLMTIHSAFPDPIFTFNNSCVRFSTFVAL